MPDLESQKICAVLHPKKFVYYIAGFNLSTRDSSFTILVKVFTNHILAENTYLANRLERKEHKIKFL